MLVRDCVGGVVFRDGQVLLICNERGEWTLPKGALPGNALSSDGARRHVRELTGVQACAVGVAGETSYEYYSTTRQTPVNNRIVWYIMEAENGGLRLNRTLGVTDGGYFDRETAQSLVTYSQDRALLQRAWERFDQRNHTI